MATVATPKRNRAQADSMTEICIDRVYPLKLFQVLSGMSRQAMREARRKGLKVRQAGRRRFVRGTDWHEYLGSLPADSE